MEVNVLILLFNVTIESTVNFLNLFSNVAFFLFSVSSFCCCGVNFPYLDCATCAINSDPVRDLTILNTEYRIAKSSRIIETNAFERGIFFLDLIVYSFDDRSANDIIVFSV